MENKLKVWDGLGAIFLRADTLFMVGLGGSVMLIPDKWIAKLGFVLPLPWQHYRPWILVVVIMVFGGWLYQTVPKVYNQFRWRKQEQERERLRQERERFQEYA